MSKRLREGRKMPSPKQPTKLTALPGVVPLEKGPAYTACIKKRGNSKADKKYCAEQVVKKIGTFKTGKTTVDKKTGKKVTKMGKKQPLYGKSITKEEF